MTETIKPTDLVKAARDAYNDADAAHKRDRELKQDRRRITQIMHIGEHLAAREIKPVGDPFTNRASGRVCVPIVQGGWDEESETQIHGVAVEWDSDAAAFGPLLVADGELDEEWDSRKLYPAGRLAKLTGLTSIGRAITNGGHLPAAPPPTAADRVRRTLSSVSADYAGPNAEAILAAADAVCQALLDVAAAIHEAGKAG